MTKNAIETASSQTARGQIVIDARGSAATAEAATSQIQSSWELGGRVPSEGA
jgi:hypothetical protein